MRCACGYDESEHPDERCPLCACGALPAEHEVVWAPHPPLLAARTEARCPGKLPNDAGRWPQLRRGALRAPAPPPRYEHRPGWGSWLWPVAEAASEPVDAPQAPPRVPARYTTSLDEIARQAMALGKQAAALGWTVDPWYYQAADGTETSLLVLRRDALRAAAFWNRAPGATWRTGGAYVLVPGQWPQRLGVKRLAESIAELG